MGVLLSTILMITSLLMQGTTTFEAEEPEVTIKDACALVLYLISNFFSHHQQNNSRGFMTLHYLKK